jgi:hypothetical protein
VTSEQTASPPDDDTAGAQSTDIDQQEAERKLAPGSDIRRRRKLLDIARDTLPRDTRNYAVADVLGEELRATFEAEGVTKNGGPPRVIVDLLASWDRLLEAMGARVVLTNLEFGNSVTMEMKPVVPPEVEDRARHRAATDPNGIVRHEDLRELIPDSVVAANTTARLLEVPGEEALAEARRYGSEVAEAYESFARTVAGHNAQVAVHAPGRREVRYERDQAERALETLKHPRDIGPVPIRIVGKLTRADSDEALFRVVLDRDRLPEEFDARRRVVEGRYTTQARTQVQQNGLWDERVIATVLAFRVMEPGKRKPTITEFQFQSVERAA